MAPTDGAGTDGGTAPAPMARRHVVALTIAGAGLAGAVGGLVAFGMASAMTDDRTSLTAGDQPSTTQTVQMSVPAEASLAPGTVTVTPTPTPTDETSATPSPTMRGLGAPGSAGDRTSSGSDDDPDDDAPDVLPERVLPTLTSTPGADDDSDDDADDAGAAVRQAANEAGTDRDESGTPTTSAPGGDAGDADGRREGDGEDRDPERGDEPTTTVPTDRDQSDGEDRDTTPAPDNALLSDRTPLTADRIDGAFRNSLAPGVPAERRDELFEGGAAARPLTDRLASLSTGSVPLLHWSVHEPVVHDGDRATVRVRSDVLFNQAWRPVTFVNVDGQWKLTRESTCELSGSLLLPCA